MSPGKGIMVLPWTEGTEVSSELSLFLSGPNR